MAADAQMMSHFYTPLHHMYHSMHSASSLHPHSRYPGMDSSPVTTNTKYPGQSNPGYPEQKYDPSSAPPSSTGTGDNSVSRPDHTSPSSSPHHAITDQYHGHSDHERNYLTPPGSGQQQTSSAGHVTPEMRDIKPVPAPGQHHSDTGLDTDKDLSESSIDAPDASSRSDEKSEYQHNLGHETGYQTPGSGYYGHHPDLSHPSYGGYSTAGPFPLSSPLSRPRSNKNKANSGKKIISVKNIWPC